MADRIPVRFTVKQSIDPSDIHSHGINGWFDGSRFWSNDMADHWHVSEVMASTVRRADVHEQAALPNPTASGAASLAMMIRRLCAYGNTPHMKAKAMALLRSHGLEGSPLRADVAPTELYPPTDVRPVSSQPDALKAAIHWWEQRRPLAWTLGQHLATPCVNCPTDADKRLAKAVAEAIAAELATRVQAPDRQAGEWMQPGSEAYEAAYAAELAVSYLRRPESRQREEVAQLLYGYIRKLEWLATSQSAPIETAELLRRTLELCEDGDMCDEVNGLGWTALLRDLRAHCAAKPSPASTGAHHG